MKKQEQILVVPNDLNIHCNTGDYFHIELDGSDSWRYYCLEKATFVDRWMAEQDSSVVQLIPYVICLSPSGKVLSYQRKGGGESRLEGKYSIGIGGHVNIDDAIFSVTTGNLSWKTVLQGAIREVTEQINVTTEYAKANLREVGIIYTPSDYGDNPAGPGPNVGEVHLGIVYLLPVEEDIIISDNEGMIKPKFVTSKGKRAKYEYWSQFILEKLNFIVNENKNKPPY